MYVSFGFHMGEPKEQTTATVLVAKNLKNGEALKDNSCYQRVFRNRCLQTCRFPSCAYVFHRMRWGRWTVSMWERMSSHRKLRVLIRNISNWRIGQYFIQELSLPDIFAKQLTLTHASKISGRFPLWKEAKPMKLILSHILVGYFPSFAATQPLIHKILSIWSENCLSERNISSVNKKLVKLFSSSVTKK